MILCDLISSLLVFSLWQAGTPDLPPTSLHFVVEREFTFLASTRTQRLERWLAGDRSYEKRGNTVVITRKDLGVSWSIDNNRKTYTERKLADSKAEGPTSGKPQDSPGNPKPAEDLRMTGFNYEPVFDWTVTDTGQTSSINGHTCSKVTAAGDADYAETNLVLWICPRIQSDAAGDPNPTMLDQIRYDSVRSFVDSELAKRGKPVLMILEETTEPAISPVMITRVRITTLESASAPADLFDLPPGLQKSALPK